MESQEYNFNAHKPARMAAILYNGEYAAQSGGLMDFWNILDGLAQNICRDLVEEIMKARKES